MSGYSAIDLGIVNARLRALKRRGAAPRLATVPSVASTSIEATDVARLTGNVTDSDASGATFDGQTVPQAPPAGGRQHARTAEVAAGTRSHERRWRDASIILVERRRGDLYRYGSIALCAALCAQVWWMFRM